MSLVTTINVPFRSSSRATWSSLNGSRSYTRLFVAPFSAAASSETENHDLAKYVSIFTPSTWVCFYFPRHPHLIFHLHTPSPLGLSTSASQRSKRTSWICTFKSIFSAPEWKEAGEYQNTNNANGTRSISLLDMSTPTDGFPFMRIHRLSLSCLNE